MRREAPSPPFECQDKEVIRKYWEDRLPQTWYSEKDRETVECYDEIERERYGYHYPFLLKDAEFNEHNGEKVLEVGCGIGTDSLQFTKGGAETYGIDLTQTAPHTCAKRFTLYGLTGHFQSMDAENLTFEENFFDYVYSFGVLHHTPDTEKAIEEVRRVLKPGKHATIMLYAKGWMYYLWFPLAHGLVGGELFKMSWKQLVHRHYEIRGDVPLVRVYSRGGIDSLFSRFSKVVAWRRPNIREVTKMIPSRAITGALERLWGGCWIVKATK